MHHAVFKTMLVKEGFCTDDTSVDILKTETVVYDELQL